MFPGTTIILAHALTGMSVVTTPQLASMPPPWVGELPSDGMRKVMRVITLSNFSVVPGPEIEGALHAALFRSTEHLYDL